MLIEYIERLRKEPKEVRRQAAYFWTLVSIVLIVLVYFGVLVTKKALPASDTPPTIAAPYERAGTR